MMYSMSGMTNISPSMENVFDQEPFGTSADGKSKEEAEAPMQNVGSDLDDVEGAKEIEKEKEGDDHREKVKVESENEELS